MQAKIPDLTLQLLCDNCPDSPPWLGCIDPLVLQIAYHHGQGRRMGYDFERRYLYQERLRAHSWVLLLAPSHVYHRRWSGGWKEYVAFGGIEASPVLVSAPWSSWEGRHQCCKEVRRKFRVLGLWDAHSKAKAKSGTPTLIPGGLAWPIRRVEQQRYAVVTEGLRQDKGPLILAENAVKDAAIESTRRCSHFRFLIETFIRGWLHGQITLALIFEFNDFFLYSIRPRNHTSS